MSPAMAVVVMMNNYFHDVATAMLLACGVTMWAIISSSGGDRSPEIVSFMLWIYTGMSKIVYFSLAWITVSAVPRILTFRTFEWAHAYGKNHVSGLIAKYMLAFLILSGGTFVWVSASRKMQKIRSQHELE